MVFIILKLLKKPDSLQLYETIVQINVLNYDKW